MQRFELKDLSGMLLACAAIAAIPLGMVISRPRPVAAQTVTALAAAVHKDAQEEILNQMVRRYEAASLNFEGPDKNHDPDLRWQQLREKMETDGAEADEAKRVIASAQPRLKTVWPCAVQRGFLADQPVWLVVGSAPRDTGFIAWACMPSAESIRDERISKYCVNTQVAIIEANAPYRALN